MSSIARIAAAAGGATAALALAGALAFWSVRGANDRAVRNAAAPLIACPAASIEVRESSVGDAADWYRVAGCGRTATLICSAPDYDCFVSP